MLDALRTVRFAALTGRGVVTPDVVNALADTLTVSDRVIADAFAVISRANNESATTFARHADYADEKRNAYAPNPELRAAMRALPERERQVVEEYYAANDIEIVAEALDIPSATVRSLAESAVLLLRSELTGKAIPEGEAKTCKKCGVVKPVTEFYKGRNDCKTCKKATTAARKRANKTTGTR